MIYFDHNATTYLLPNVKAKMIDFINNNLPFNPSAIHSLGQKAKNILETIRANILSQIAPNYKLIFVPSATIANNIMMNSFENIIVSSIEHSSVLKNQKNLILVDQNGYIDQNHLCELMKNIKKPFLVSVIHGHNETGVINDIKNIADLVHSYGGFLHTDAVQSFGKIIKNLDELNADYYTISAHKIGGPIGVAALIYRHKIQPLIIGGGQELFMNAGTENLLAIIGFEEAINSINIEEYEAKTLPTKLFLEDELIKKNCIIISKNANRLPNTTMFANTKISNKSQLISFDMAGFCTSIGSACSSGTVKLSPTLKAMNIEDNIANSAIRVSLGKNNTIKEIQSFLLRLQM